MKPNQKLKNWRINIKQFTHKNLQDEINALIKEKGLDIRPVWVSDISEAERAISTYKFKKVMNALSLVYDDIEYDEWGMVTKSVTGTSEPKETYSKNYKNNKKLEITLEKLELSLRRQAELEREIGNLRENVAQLKLESYKCKNGKSTGN